MHSTAEAVAERPAAVEEAFEFGAYMKQRAVLVNEALERSVPLQYPEVINESMRCGRPRLAPLCRTARAGGPGAPSRRSLNLALSLLGELAAHVAVHVLGVNMLWESERVRCGASAQA